MTKFGSLSVGASSGPAGPGETDQSRHGVTWGGIIEGEAKSGKRNARSKSRQRPAGKL